MTHHTRLLYCSILGILCVLVGAGDSLEASTQLAVTYRTAEVAYIDGGHNASLTVGEEVLVVNDVSAARLEVTHLANSSAACRILFESTPVAPGDRVARQVVMPAEHSTNPAPIPVEPVLPTAVSAEVSHSPLPPAGVTGMTSSAPLVAEITGSLTFDFESFRSNSDREGDYRRRATRLSLRARGGGSGANEIRLRMSGRDRGSRTDDRLYEAALVRQPAESPLRVSLGRLAGGSLTGHGPLDGVLGQLSLRSHLSMGGFYGSRADIGSLGFGSPDRRFGVFAEYLSSEFASRSRSGLDLSMAGIREMSGSEVSRDYLSFEGRFASRDSRWWIQQRAEIDLNSGWRHEATGRQVQLSSLSFSLSRRLSDRGRLSITYDRFQLYRDADSRFLNDRFLDDRPRHAVRTRLSLGSSRNVRLSLGASVRAREGDPDRSYSYSANALSRTVTPLRLTFGADVLAFSNPMTDGHTARTRATKALGRKHQIYLDLGLRQWRSRPASGALSHESHWFRLGGTFDLPYNLSVRGEHDIESGDAFAGQRSFFSLRYQFRHRQ